LSEQGYNGITINVPLEIINDMYTKIFVKKTDPFAKEADPIYNEELQGKAIVAGKNITLLKFKPKLKLGEQIQIEHNDGNNTPNGRPKLRGTAWFHFSPLDEKVDQETYELHPISEPMEKPFEADLDISIDQRGGKIQISPKYAVLEVKIKGGTGNTDEEPFCQLSIPLQLEKLKVELPVGVSKFNVQFQAPINKTFSNSGSEFPIQGTIDKSDNIVFNYPVELEEQKK